MLIMGTMSVLLSCRNLSHTAGTKSLFRERSLSVSRGDKIGLNGHNGFRLEGVNTSDPQTS